PAGILLIPPRKSLSSHAGSLSVAPPRAEWGTSSKQEIGRARASPATGEEGADGGHAAVLPAPWETECAAERRRRSELLRESKAPSSWGDGGDCCSWERIMCDNTTHRVSRLNLFQTYQENLQYCEDECPNLNLTIFSSFRGLQLLNFSGHHACLQNFEGLQGLSKLKYLDLSCNSFQGGGIPGSVGKLVSLEVINLNGNNIDFRNLRNLRELHLGSSQLRGSLPASIFALPRLEYLDLSYNLFEGHIPINLSRNLRLRELYLTFNRLSGGLPASLFALLRLAYLDLSDNLFQGHIL
uniref:Leucine-rich repeat-containing N-terminal plant-type domain-containing protein n=1 Tax=Aegilops tauschii subsp. strangulata TaxID=200361 RepID=A0A453AEI3_AEGTS